MKKLICLFSVLSLFLTSCSGDESNNVVNPSSDVLPIKIIQTYEDGSTFSTDITYDGNKLLKLIYSDGSVINYTYSGSLVSKVEYFRNEILLQEDLYEYENDKLINFKRLEYDDVDDDYFTDVSYVYNSDGTVSYTESSGQLNNPSPYISTGVISLDEYGHVISIVNSNNYTETFTYDDKHSPFKNILGLDKLPFQDVYPNSYKHNFISEVNPDNTTTHVYTYNSNNYPITDEEDDGYGIQTTQYFYNN